MGAAEINYYSILGVSASADTNEIKKRYRALSKSYHPDTPGGDSAKMVLLNEAYSVLSDPVKRHFYEPPAPKRVQTATQPVRTAYAYGSQPQQKRPVRRTQQTVYYEEEEPKNTWTQILSYVLAVPLALIIFAFGYPHLQQFIPKAPEVTAWPQATAESTAASTIEAPTTVESQPVNPAPVQQPTTSTPPPTSSNSTTTTPSSSATNTKLNHSIRYKYYTNQ